jgi:hypothetical protein
MPETIWPESAAKMTETQKALAKQTIIDLIRSSLPHALENANLFTH